MREAEYTARMLKINTIIDKELYSALTRKKIQLFDNHQKVN